MYFCFHSVLFLFIWLKSTLGDDQSFATDTDLAADNDVSADMYDNAVTTYDCIDESAWCDAIHDQYICIDRYSPSISSHSSVSTHSSSSSLDLSWLYSNSNQHLKHKKFTSDVDAHKAKLFENFASLRKEVILQLDKHKETAALGPIKYYYYRLQRLRKLSKKKQVELGIFKHLEKLSDDDEMENINNIINGDYDLNWLINGIYSSSTCEASFYQMEYNNDNTDNTVNGDKDNNDDDATTTFSISWEVELIFATFGEEIGIDSGIDNGNGEEIELFTSHSIDRVVSNKNNRLPTQSVIIMTAVGIVILLLIVFCIYYSFKWCCYGSNSNQHSNFTAFRGKSDHRYQQIV